jgi:hypothetical protein
MGTKKPHRPKSMRLIGIAYWQSWIIPATTGMKLELARISARIAHRGSHFEDQSRVMASAKEITARTRRITKEAKQAAPKELTGQSLPLPEEPPWLVALAIRIADVAISMADIELLLDKR